MKEYTTDKFGEPMVQTSIEWACLHIGRVTASELGHLLSPKWKVRDGEMPKTYLYKKAAEMYRGQPMCNLNPHSSGWSADQGLILEEEAIPFVSLELNRDVRRVAFCETDDGLAGCSPDGLLDPDGGVEIKSPAVHTHVRYLDQGVLPEEYVCQVHHSMYVTGRPWWMFVSYRRFFPPFILKVERDPAISALIENTVREFHVKLNATVARLRALDKR